MTTTKHANVTRHDDIAMKKEQNTRNLRYNLLLLRETFHIYYKGEKNLFYDSLGISEDSFTNFLHRFILSKQNRENIENALSKTVLPKKFYRAEKPGLYKVNSKIPYLQDKYFDSDASTQKKKAISKEIRQELVKSLSLESKKMFILSITCEQLNNKEKPDIFHQMYLAADMMAKISISGMNKEIYDTESFSSFITEIANKIIDIESEFPGFYSAVQLQKRNMDAASLMNQIADHASQLSALELDKSQTDSVECKYMLKSLGDLLVKISSSLEN